MLGQEALFGPIVVGAGDGGDAGPAPSVANVIANVGMFSCAVTVAPEASGVMAIVVGFVKGAADGVNPYPVEKTSEEHAKVPGTQLMVAMTGPGETVNFHDSLSGFAKDETLFGFACTASNQADIDLLQSGGAVLRKVSSGNYGQGGGGQQGFQGQGGYGNQPNYGGQYGQGNYGQQTNQGDWNQGNQGQYGQGNQGGPNQGQYGQSYQGPTGYGQSQPGQPAQPARRHGR